MAADLDFASGNYTLTKKGKKELDGVVPQIQSAPGAKVVVYGYTDNKPVGAALKKRGIVDNLDLSSKRANEVVRYLISKGIDANILSAKGRGDTHPVASNDTPKGRAQNRRIEITLLPARLKTVKADLAKEAATEPASKPDKAVKDKDRAKAAAAAKKKRKK